MQAQRIPLRRRDGSIRAYALVDAADYQGLVSRGAWKVLASGYVCRTERELGNWRKQRVVYMHRVILGLEPGDGHEADHINGDRADNRRANLRVVTHAENQQNHPAWSRSTTSRFRGVHFAARPGKWIARVRHGDGRRRELGAFDTELEAAQAAEAFRAAHLPFALPDPELS